VQTWQPKGQFTKWSWLKKKKYNNDVDNRKKKNNNNKSTIHLRRFVYRDDFQAGVTSINVTDLKHYRIINFESSSWSFILHLQRKTAWYRPIDNFPHLISVSNRASNQDISTVNCWWSDRAFSSCCCVVSLETRRPLVHPLTAVITAAHSPLPSFHFQKWGTFWYGVHSSPCYRMSSSAGHTRCDGSLGFHHSLSRFTL
jgi:hypothetical protein